MSWLNYLIVFIGAGLGGLCRYLMSPAIQRAAGDSIFPFGTMSVNMLGCVFIGLLGALAEAKGLLHGETRLLLFVGVLGGFTTFSSFGFETFQLMREGAISYAVLNAILQVVLGIVCVWIGWVIGRVI